MNEITRFDPLKLADAIKNCVKNGIYKGEIITCREDMYHILAEKIGCSDSSLRKWCLTRSTGPNDPTWVNALEKELGVSLRLEEADYLLLMENIAMTKEEYSDYAKKNINKGYVLMKEYISSPYVDDEESLVDFWEELSKLRAGIPKLIFIKMKDFCEENFSPLVYKNSFDNDLETFLRTVLVIEGKLDKFADEVLNPIICH